MRKGSELHQVVEALKKSQKLVGGIKDVADKSGVSYPTIYRLMSGDDCKYSTIDSLYRFYFCKRARKP